ncbi:MAG: hypothetical protein ABIP36_08520 [Acidimicrobiales bacterium]
MVPVWYRVRRQLRTSWAGAVTVAVVVAVVGGLVLILTVGVVRTLSAPERYTTSLGRTFEVALEQFGGRPRIAEVEGLPAVADAESATFVFGGVIGDHDAEPIEGFVFAGSPRAFGARVIEGRPLDPAIPGGFVATRSWLTESKAQVGDRLRLLTITQAQADELGFDVAEPAGPTLPVTLVGVIDGPNELEDETPLALFPAALLDAGDVGLASSVGLVALAPSATLDDLRAQLDGLPRGDASAWSAPSWYPLRFGPRCALRGRAWRF